MGGSPYQVVYDITKTAPPLRELMSWLGGLLIGILIIVGIFALSRNKLARNIVLVVGSLWLIGWLGLGGLGIGNITYQYYKCVNWVKSGDYSIITGTVTDFDPMPYGGHKSENFSVDGVHFEYSDFDLSKCGFNNTTSHGGPIVKGLPVRIGYRNGRILILEINKQNSP
jgi:hypothetical protein